MRKLLLIFISLIIQTTLTAQCSYDYVGTFGVNSCADTGYNWTATIKAIAPDKIVIMHFAGIPLSIIGCLDTIIADLTCSSDSLTLETVSYNCWAGALIYSGHGFMNGSSLFIHYHQINPQYQQDFCYRYDNITGVNSIDISDSKFEIFPNPAKDKIIVNFNYSNDTYLQVFNLIGAKQIEILLDRGSATKSIDLTGIDNGLYFYSIIDKTDNKIKTGKLIIIK